MTNFLMSKLDIVGFTFGKAVNVYDGLSFRVVRGRESLFYKHNFVALNFTLKVLHMS